MSEVYKIVVDTNKINALLTELNDRQAKNAIKGGLRRSVSIIRKQAQVNLSSAVPNSGELKKEINQAVYKNASGARVDLLDKRRKDSKQFTLKFFELGTKRRTNVRGGRTGANRGYISAYHFLGRAERTKRTEAETNLENNIIQSINRIKKRNK